MINTSDESMSALNPSITWIPVGNKIGVSGIPVILFIIDDNILYGKSGYLDSNEILVLFDILSVNRIRTRV